MILYPNEYKNSVRDIDIEFLNKNNIKALILDVDNTLIDFYKKIPDGVSAWCEELKKQGIKMCIVSNTNKKEKVEMVANKLELPYFYLAKKPFKGGLKKAIKLLNEKNENIAAVGDQIFTDILGANRLKLFSILVKPLAEKDLLITRIKRPLENFVIKKYLKYERGKIDVHK